jgi:putative addiction module component (TIGR02574 family)
MIPTEISNSALSLPEVDRLELARALVESVAAEHEVAQSIQEGVRRIDEVASGRIVGLTEEEYRAAAR